MCTSNKQEQEAIIILVWPDGSYQEVEPSSNPPSDKPDDYKICEILLSDLDSIAEKISRESDPIDAWVREHLNQVHASS